MIDGGYTDKEKVPQMRWTQYDAGPVHRSLL
jgi:hypothetical protein